MKYKSKLKSLSLALSSVNSDSEDLRKYAGFVSGLIGFGKGVSGAIIGGAVGEKLFGSTSEIVIEKTLGLPAAKNGFNYTAFINSPSYRDSIKSFSIYSVVGFLEKEKKKTKIADQVNSEPVKIGRSISAKGEPPPLGFKFAPIYGVIYITPISGEPFYVAASGSVDAAGIFKMQVTDESIASTESLFQDGQIESVQKDITKVWHPMGDGLVGSGVEMLTGIGGQEYGVQSGVDTKEKGKRDVIKGVGDFGGAVGLSAGTSLVAGTGLTGALGAQTTLATIGAGSVSSAVFGVVLPLIAAGSAGWAVGRGIDKYFGLGDSIIKWYSSPAAKEGKNYSLKLVAGKWAPHIKDFSISAVYGDLLDKKGKEISAVHNDSITKAAPVSSSEEYKARGDKPKDGGVFIPNKIIGEVKFKNGYMLNILSSSIRQEGTKTIASINEADLTAKIAKNVSLGRFPQISGVQISGEEIKAANNAVQTAVASSFSPKKQKPQATSGGKTSSDWSKYLTNTPNGDSMKRVWDRWSPSLGVSPDSYSDFVTVWKQLRDLSRLKDLGVRNISIMIQALGEGREADSKSPDASNPEKNYSAAYAAIQSGDINAVSSILKNKLS
jgi:hypothetical protein